MLLKIKFPLNDTINKNSDIKTGKYGNLKNTRNKQKHGNRPSPPSAKKRPTHCKFAYAAAHDPACKGGGKRRRRKKTKRKRTKRRRRTRRRKRRR